MWSKHVNISKVIIHDLGLQNFLHNGIFEIKSYTFGN